MIYYTIVFLCMAGLFLSLLTDRFRLWTTLGATGVVYLLSLAIALFLRGHAEDPAAVGQLPCVLGALLFFAASLFLYVNNLLQKLFVALLALSSYAFLEALVPQLLGLLPFSPAGAPGGAISVLVFLLFYLLLALCLYSPIRHYSDRGVSGFLAGMCLLLVFQYILCLGKLDFLFRAVVPAARLLLSTALYLLLIFCFRSLYHAGQFREKSTWAAAQERMLQLEAGNFDDTMAAVREVRMAQRTGEYALDTVNVLLADGYEEKVPQYIAQAKRNSAANPILARRHSNPHIDAVLAAKAAFAAQNKISFEANVALGNGLLTADEICVILSEMLTRACREAARYDGPRKVRLTVSPTERSLRFEVQYSGGIQEPEPFTLKGKNLSDVLAWLLDETPGRDDLRGLEEAGSIVSRYGGKLSVSGAGDETILQAQLRF